MNNIFELLHPLSTQDVDITSSPAVHSLSMAYDITAVRNTGDDSDDTSFFREYLFEIIMAVLLTIQISVLIVGSIYRYTNYRDVGLYSLQVARPARYKVKLLIHLA